MPYKYYKVDHYYNALYFTYILLCTLIGKKVNIVPIGNAL